MGFFKSRVNNAVKIFARWDADETSNLMNRKYGHYETKHENEKLVMYNIHHEGEIVLRILA
jgi:hypothetical protein